MVSDDTLLFRPESGTVSVLDVNGGVQVHRMGKSMKKLIIAGALAAATLASPAVALAGSDNAAPGTPGEKNCAGQTRAWVTQGNFDGTIGLGNFVASTKDVQFAINFYCDNGFLP